MASSGRKPPRRRRRRRPPRPRNVIGLIMSRRRRATKRPLAEDAKYHSPLVTRLVNTVMTYGKRSLAQRIVYGAFERMVEKTPNANPLEVPTDRQFALAMRWLVDLADARKGVPMNEALAAEILEAFQGQGSAIRKRDDVHKMAQANKAFAHFR